MEQNKTINPRTVSISEVNWEFLQQIRIKEKFRSVNQALDYILLKVKSLGFKHGDKKDE